MSPVRPRPPIVEANRDGSVCGRQRQPAAVAAQKTDGADMPAKCAGRVMVFAMDIVGDGAAERDEARSRRHREKPAVRHDELQDRRNACAGGGAQNSLDRIEVDDAIELRHVDQIAIPVETGIAVGAPQTRSASRLEFRARPRRGGS